MKVKNRIPLLMMIDDDEIILTVNRHKINKTGLVERILSFKSAQRALEHLMTTDQWPDIILCDIHMPIIDGWEFIDYYNKILNKSNTQGMLCIHSDISSDFDLDELEKRKSVDMFITKPLTEDKIYLFLEYYYNKYSLPEYSHSMTKFITS